MSSRLQNPFVGAAFQSSLKPRNVNYLGYLGNKFPRKPRYDIIPRAKKNDWISHGIRFSQSFGENVEILWKNMGLRSGFVVKSVKEPFTRSKAIVRSLSKVWEEGLLLFQCSVFYAVISGVCLLLWYSQLKENTLIESKLFPSVCTTLSDYIQCDLHFCKAFSVKRMQQLKKLHPVILLMETYMNNIRLEDALRNSKDSHLKDFTSTNPYTTTEASVNKSSTEIPSSSNNSNHNVQQGDGSTYRVGKSLQYPPFSDRNPSNVLDRPISEINSEFVSTTFRYDIVASTGLPSRRSRPSFLDSILPNEENINQLIHSFYLFIYLLNFIFSIIGALLGTYEDNRFKSESKKPYLKSIGSLNLGGGPELEKKLKYTEHVCSGVILGKELVNAPPNVLTPGSLSFLFSIVDRYIEFWIDTADKQPCIVMGGMIPWKLHVTGKLFHRGLAQKGDSLLIILKSFIEKQSAQSTRKLSLCQQQSIHSYFLITLVTALLFMHKAEHILYQHTSLNTFMIV
uniref:Uncharacterized protein n=1 Tax=Lactuca sativa TaxID=4236 RepID=A0A9R1UMD2_LACSA|nr:hypothetical protein LSAT_V11C800430230 [Lactuca sativa]